MYKSANEGKEMKEYENLDSMKQAFKRMEAYKKRYISVGGKLCSVTVDVVIQNCMTGKVEFKKTEAVEEYEICPYCWDERDAEDYN